MKEYVTEIPAPIPKALIYYPCEPVGPGTTVNSLQKAYVQNTYCIGEYKEVIDGVDVYNKKQEGLRDGK